MCGDKLLCRNALMDRACSRSLNQMQWCVRRVVYAVSHAHALHESRQSVAFPE
jgi:hypothetical protein